jgi:hypothetical protein
MALKKTCFAAEATNLLAVDDLKEYEENDQEVFHY